MKKSASPTFFTPQRSAAANQGQPVVNLKLARNIALCSEPAARALLPYELAKRLNALPLVMSNSSKHALRVAVEAGYDPVLLQELKFACSCEILPAEVPEGTLEDAIFIAYKGDAQVLEHSASKLSTSSSKPAEFPEHPFAATDLTRFLDSLIEHGLALQASDIHIFPKRDGSYVKMRIHGELLTRTSPVGDLQQHTELVRRIKVLAKLDTTRSSLPLDGSFVLNSSSIRVSTLPTLHGEKVVLRLSSGQTLRALDELGLPIGLNGRLCGLSHLQHGLVVFCGSTGSGKTTSLYALLDSLADETKSIQTVEDPIEFDLPGVNQTQVCDNTGLSYSTALRAILRQDPDFIMLGEIRDKDTAQIACQAALSGHLVLTSVHAGSLFDALQRFNAFGIDDAALIQSGNIIIHQSLMPTLCTACAVPDLTESLKTRDDVLQPVGCSECDYSGYSGRTLKASWLCFKELQQNPGLLRKGIRFQYQP